MPLATLAFILPLVAAAGATSAAGAASSATGAVSSVTDAVSSAKAGSAAGSTSAPRSMPLATLAFILPLVAAVATASQYKRMARAASSFAGTGNAMPSGDTFESRIAITGIPRTLASLMASSSLFASMTNITSGMPPMSRIPPRLISSLSRSRVI